MNIIIGIYSTYERAHLSLFVEANPVPFISANPFVVQDHRGDVVVVDQGTMIQTARPSLQTRDRAIHSFEGSVNTSKAMEEEACMSKIVEQKDRKINLFQFNPFVLADQVKANVGETDGEVTEQQQLQPAKSTRTSKFKFFAKNPFRLWGRVGKKKIADDTEVKTPSVVERALLQGNPFIKADQSQGGHFTDKEPTEKPAIVLPSTDILRYNPFIMIDTMRSKTKDLTEENLPPSGGNPSLNMLQSSKILAPQETLLTVIRAPSYAVEIERCLRCPSPVDSLASFKSVVFDFAGGFLQIEYITEQRPGSWSELRKSQLMGILSAK